MLSAMGEKSVSSRRRSGGRSWVCGSAKRMREMKSAEAAKDSESRTNTVFRPNHTATNPPSAAPSAKLMDHVAAESAFATAMFGPEVMLGMVARCPGSNSAQHTVSKNSSVNSSHSESRERTSRSEEH